MNILEIINYINNNMTTSEVFFLGAVIGMGLFMVVVLALYKFLDWYLYR